LVVVMVRVRFWGFNEEKGREEGRGHLLGFGLLLRFFEDDSLLQGGLRRTRRGKTATQKDEESGSRESGKGDKNKWRRGGGGGREREREKNPESERDARVS
jgi:hypothetical protein